jgi:hypothetical protein
MAVKRQEIPSWAFINAQIIQKAVRTGALVSSVRIVEAGYKMKPGSLAYAREAHLVSLLYCLIVVPKEVWLLSQNHSVYGNIEKEWLLSLFTIQLPGHRFPTHPVYYLIYHLRNAVAHAHFSIEDDGRFAFWDREDASLEPYFRASIYVDGVQDFLSKVGALLANLRVGQTNG